MQENETINNSSVRKEDENEALRNSKDSFFFVTIIQIVLCALLISIIFFTVKSSDENAQKLRQDFLSLQSQSITDENGEDLLGQIKAFMSSSLDFTKTVSQTKIDEGVSQTVSFSVNETEKESQIQESSIEKDEEKEETSEEENSNESMGGEDIEIFKATENTSFSPIETTCAIVAPVDSKKYTSKFGYRINPITNEKSFHTGLDIAAPLGSKIRAAYTGTVRKTGEDSRSGKYIILTHSDGFETFYCHCSKILANQGAVIRQGETIALVGSTGWSTGPHLHFEVRKNGTRLNPMYLLNEDDSSDEES